MVIFGQLVCFGAVPTDPSGRGASQEAEAGTEAGTEAGRTQVEQEENEEKVRNIQILPHWY